MSQLFAENQVIERNIEHLPSGHVLLVDALPDNALRAFSEARPDITWHVFTPFADTYETLSAQTSSIQSLEGVYTGAWLSANNNKAAPLPQFNAVIIYYPKTKQRFEYYTSMVSQLLAEDADWFVVGEKKGGVKSCDKGLKPYVYASKKLDAARHCMLFHGVYNNRASEASLEDWFNTTSTQVKTQGASGQAITVDLQLASLPGVFSATKLDAGTDLLLQHIHSLQGRGLDFGCGCGVIATTLAKAFDVNIDALDVDALAVESTRRSFELNGIDGTAIHSNGLGQISKQHQYDFIVSNPPFHTGINTDYSIVESFLKGSKARLKSRYQMWIVANSFLPYQDWFAKFLKSANTIVNNKRFSVYHIK
ncbi:class I SAM-dependent methyltransferase [Psychrosphaera ytuae]|uniref:Class I SAM-dependent methyltransferase n=1 Tax=Psychrosphaera ytuae TaxID=2820710 RepID=A0A975DAC4_9GAMM|nr:class I SAM-dependent methyltransferase [Psychrosphaera ytuae]QTH63530.1 class I SAM-dependent methyltransferase [Psychrosphaera ytuae]